MHSFTPPGHTATDLGRHKGAGAGAGEQSGVAKRAGTRVQRSGHAQGGPSVQRDPPGSAVASRQVPPLHTRRPPALPQQRLEAVARHGAAAQPPPQVPHEGCSARQARQEGSTLGSGRRPPAAALNGCWRGAAICRSTAVGMAGKTVTHGPRSLPRRRGYGCS